MFCILYSNLKENCDVISTYSRWYPLFLDTIDATCFYYYGRNYAKNTVDFDNDIKCYESIGNQIGWIKYDFKELKGLALFQLFKWFKFLKSGMVLLLFWDEEKTSNLDFFFTCHKKLGIISIRILKFEWNARKKNVKRYW